MSIEYNKHVAELIAYEKKYCSDIKNSKKNVQLDQWKAS